MSGIGVASLGHAHPALARALARSGGDAAAHVEPVLPSAAGRAGRAALGAHGPRARVLLQQRHRGHRSLPEVRAPLLARGGETGADEVRRVHARVSRPDDGLAVGDLGRALPRAVRAARSRRDVRRRRRPGRAGRARRRRRRPPSSSSRFRAKAACGRCRRRSPARSTPACRRTGRAAHRRRSAVAARGRTGPFLLQPGDRPDAGSRSRSARRSAPACRSARRWSASRVAAAVAPGDHGTTYGGNLLACRAALTFLDALDGGSAVDRCRAYRRTCSRGCRRSPPRHAAVIEDVRGAGLIAGLELTSDAAPVVERGARARAAREPHGDDRRAAAAAVHRDRTRRGRSRGHPDGRNGGGVTGLGGIRQ